MIPYRLRMEADLCKREHEFTEKLSMSACDRRSRGLRRMQITLGDDEYFVLGDNRNNSEDSRYANIGNIKKEYIIGKAWFVDIHGMTGFWIL